MRLDELRKLEMNQTFVRFWLVSQVLREPVRIYFQWYSKQSIRCYTWRDNAGYEGRIWNVFRTKRILGDTMKQKITIDHIGIAAKVSMKGVHFGDY